MKSKITCSEVLLWTKKKIIMTPLKFLLLTNFKEAHTFDGKWICTTSDRKNRWIFGNFIQGAEFDHSNCSSSSILIWNNLFNYFLYLWYLGSFKFTDSFFKDKIKIMKGYFLLELVYLRYKYHSFCTESVYWEIRSLFAEVRWFFVEFCSI